MSEQPQGPGWWQASDGKYYPPESAPGAQGAAGQEAPTTLTPSTATAEAEPPKKSIFRKWWFWLLVVIGLFIVIGLLSGGGDTDDTAATSPTAEPTATEEQTAAPEETEEPAPTEEPAQTEEPQEPEGTEPVIPGDGIFQVGTDIAPGIYYANTTSAFAYWARLSDASGDFESIIANSNPLGQAVVEIKEGDAFFETRDVDGWRPISEIPADPQPAIPGDGVWIVGVQIQPGTYSGTAEGDFAYWARLSDASGDFGAIIANDNPVGNAIVQIAETDAFFETKDVPGWTKTG